MAHVKTWLAYTVGLAAPVLIAFAIQGGKAHERPAAAESQKTQMSNLVADQKGVLDSEQEASRLRPPPGMEGQAFGYEYPSMKAVPWPGEIALIDARRQPDYVAH